MPYIRRFTRLQFALLATSLMAAGATVANLTGPLDYAFRTYTILPDPATTPTVSGNISAIPVPTTRFSVATAAAVNATKGSRVR